MSNLLSKVQLRNPRASLAGYRTDTKWSLAQIAYFRSYATWHYLPEPFLFAWPGAVTEEIEPWTENGAHHALHPAP